MAMPYIPQDYSDEIYNGYCINRIAPGSKTIAAYRLQDGFRLEADTKDQLKDMIDITINRFDGKWSFLSNFSPHTVRWGAFTYQTAEHAYQAGKAELYSDHVYIARCDTPGQAKRAGRSVLIRDDWEEVKDRFMYEIVYSKFAQNKDILDKLVNETHNYPLEEGNVWGDTYWGTVDGFGHNKLGEILMVVRGELWSRVA